MKILVTGGAGYIGAHTCVELLKKGHEVLVFDNLLNSSSIALDRVKLITNQSLKFIEGDVRDYAVLSRVMKEFVPEAVMHFAGLKAVSESIINPLEYYDVNVRGSLEILRAMETIACNLLIFSSSATVYGIPEYLPCDEDHPTSPINPYGRSKLMVERLLEDWVKARRDHKAVCLRYFNPVGAHVSGLIGEDPRDTPNNLMPFIAQTASGRREQLSIFGGDYDTRDGTGERDYIHVSDLANGHLLALEYHKILERFQVLNLGSGQGTTVQEFVEEFERSTNQKIKREVLGRRPGDIAITYADTRLASRLINFRCEKSITHMCIDTWNWQKNNPNGYSNNTNIDLLRSQKI